MNNSTSPVFALQAPLTTGSVLIWPKDQINEAIYFRSGSQSHFSLRKLIPYSQMALE